MKWVIEIEHDKDGLEDYNEEQYEKDAPLILKAIKTAIKNTHYPRIGEMIHVNENGYYITLIIYYADDMRYYVSDEKESVFDRLEDLK